MQTLKMPFLRISSFWVFLVTACASNVGKDYTPIPIEPRVYHVLYFSNSTIDYVYKANITVYGNELSGILMAKKISDTMHRVVFTTEFGKTLFDFEISETDFRINTIVAELNKKKLVTILKTDFRLLFKEYYTILAQAEDKNSTIYRSKDGNSYNDLFVLKDRESLFKILRASKRKQKTNVYFASENADYAENIVIEHQDIKLRIALYYFK